MLARDLMSTSVIPVPTGATVKEDTPITEVMQLMLNQGIHRLPVMADGRLVGIITRHDFLKLIAT